MSEPIEPHIFTTWMSMMRRCYYTKDSSYSLYGERGIVVCERWHSPQTFAADMGIRPEKHSLDRIDNDGSYSPANCRWADIHQQLANRRITRRLTFNGLTLTIDEWAERTGLNRITIAGRMRRGWPDAVILSTPTDREGHRVLQRNTTVLLKKAAISRTVFYARLRRGWTEERALNTPQQKRGVKPGTKRKPRATRQPKGHPSRPFSPEVARSFVSHRKQSTS